MKPKYDLATLNNCVEMLACRLTSIILVIEDIEEEPASPRQKSDLMKLRSERESISRRLSFAEFLQEQALCQK